MEIDNMKCSVCKKKDAYMMTKSLITKLKSYFCEDCFVRFAEEIINAHELKKVKEFCKENKF